MSFAAEGGGSMRLIALLLVSIALSFCKDNSGANAARPMPSTIDEAARVYPNLKRLTPAQRVRFAFRLTETQRLTACLQGRVQKGSIRVLRHWHKEIGSKTWELASIEVTPELNGEAMPPKDQVAFISECLNKDMRGYKRPVDDSDGPLPGSFETDMIVTDGGMLEIYKSSPHADALEQITWAGGHSFPVETDSVYDDLARFKP